VKSGADFPQIVILGGMAKRSSQECKFILSPSLSRTNTVPYGQAGTKKFSAGKYLALALKKLSELPSIAQKRVSLRDTEDFHRVIK
jgi:hypothetical protein